jgi:hypothetical protein
VEFIRAAGAVGGPVVGVGEIVEGEGSGGVRPRLVGHAAEAVPAGTAIGTIVQRQAAGDFRMFDGNNRSGSEVEVLDVLCVTS